MSDVVSDLEFRVVQVQVFVGEGRVKGWRFAFRHWSTQQQELQPDRTVIAGPSTRQDVDLKDQEFLVDVKFVASMVSIKGKRVSAVTGLEFITSARRNICVGSGWSELYTPTAFPTGTITKEVRAINATLTSQKQAIGHVTPTFRTIPARAQLDSSRKLIEDAAANKCHHPQECARLEKTAGSAYNALRDALARGVIVPVATISAFLGVAPKTAAVLTSCGRSAVTWRGKRKPALLEYTAMMEAIRDFAQEQLPRAELSTLEFGDAVASLTSTSVPTMVRNAIATSRTAIAAKLFVKHLALTPFDDVTLVHEVVEALVPVSEADGEGIACFPMVRDVVNAYASVSDESVTAVMETYKTKQATLCEFAVRARDAWLLHWLVVKALMDPFDVPQEISRLEAASESQALVTFSTAKPNGDAELRRRQYERLIGLVRSNGAAEDVQAEMTKLLEALMDREEFQRGMLAIAMAKHDVSAREIMALVPKITSVYDLGYLAPVASSILSASEMKPFFRAYCDSVVAKELVQANDDCAFFNTALRQAEARGYLEMFEVERLRIEAGHINTEAAPYIRELKLAMRQLHSRLGCLEMQVLALRQSLSQLTSALRLKEITEMRRLQVRRAVALVASILYVVGGQVIQVSHDVFESWNVTTMLGDGTVAADCVDTALDPDRLRDAIVDSGVQLVLANANINADDFVAELQAAVRMIHQARLTASSPATTPRSVVPPSGRVRRVVMTTEARKEGSIDSYHAAVLASGGDLDRFKSLERALVASQADVNARVEIVVEKRTTRKNNSIKMRTKTRVVPAHVYASHLGYRAIVDHLLANEALRKRSEFAFVTKWRARRLSKMEVEAAVGARAA